MERKTAFIGHRNLWEQNIEIRQNLYKEVEKQILNGCRFFTMGRHGDFDKLALSVCRQLRKTYQDIEIEVVITSFKTIEPIIEHDKIFEDEKFIPFKDVRTVMYEIEEVYFKKQIIESNKQMLDTCDTLICYIDTTKFVSGAKIALKYALKKGLKILNLYK